MRDYRKLTFKQSLVVADYIKANHGKFNGKTQELIAQEASDALGFTVPVSSMARVAKEIGLPIGRRKKEKLLNAQPNSVDERVFYRRIRTLARIRRKIVDELGMTLKPIQDQLLTQLCQYDTTAPDDEQ